MEAPKCTCGRDMELKHQCIYHPEDGFVWYCQPCQLWKIGDCMRAAMAMQDLTNKCLYGFMKSLTDRLGATVH
jgi:hypothetical protein